MSFEFNNSDFSYITFIIPCMNEAQNIPLVLAECFEQCPGCSILVCDNNSSDDTGKVAFASGAEVIYEQRSGKGYAVRALIPHISSKIVVMVDGDYTYDLSNLRRWIEYFVKNNYDVASGNRLISTRGHTRLGHYVGNQLFVALASALLARRQYDIFSGLYIMSSDFLLSFPLHSRQFELESELATHIARMDSKYFSFPAALRPRQYGSSKLSTLSDGLKILGALLKNILFEFPLKIFLPLSILISSLGIYLFMSPFYEYLLMGYVKTLPRLVFGAFLITIALNLVLAGLVMRSISLSRLEQRLYSLRVIRCLGRQS
jgi:glycosyltransferase involved in cell wall biosynthesis